MVIVVVAILLSLNLALITVSFIGLLGKQGCKEHGYWKTGGSILILSLVLLVFETKGYLISLSLLDYFIF